MLARITSISENHALLCEEKRSHCWSCGKGREVGRMRVTDTYAATKSSNSLNLWSGFMRGAADQCAGVDTSVTVLKMKAAEPEDDVITRRRRRGTPRKRRGLRALLSSLRREYDRWEGGVRFMHCVSRARSARTWSEASLPKEGRSRDAAVLVGADFTSRISPQAFAPWPGPVVGEAKIRSEVKFPGGGAPRQGR